MPIITSNDNKQQSESGDSTSLWQDIIESIKGSERDFTQIPLKTAVILLAIPMVIEMIMESIFALVDIYFVSRLGAGAIATVGITESLMTLIYAIAFGMSAATTALISRRIGEKNKEEASVEAWQAILTSISISLIIMIPGILYAPNLLKLMGADSSAIANSAYTSIMFGGNFIIMLLFICNAIFRGAGDAAIAMKVLVIGNIINIILDPILISKMGISGAAIATNIGRGTAVVLQLYILFNGSSRINLNINQFMPIWSKIKQIIQISLGGIAQSLIITISWIFMMRLISPFGSEAVAGYTIAIRLIIFSILPSFGLSNAASTLTGQNLGAKRPDRAEKAVRKIAWINMISLSFIGLLLYVFAHELIGLFSSNLQVIEFGQASLKIIACGFPFYGIGMVMVQAFNGSGDTRTPTWVNFIAFWVIEIPLAWYLSTFTNLNEEGIFYSILIAESFMALYALLLFRQGKWKNEKI